MDCSTPQPCETPNANTTAADLRLHDLHCHLDFMSNGESVAAEAAASGSFIFANTVTPRGFQSAHARFSDCGNVRVGLGLHPWYIEHSATEGTDDQPRGLADQLDAFRSLIPSTAFIGEVGLDLGKRQLPFAQEQLQAFSSIARWCAAEGDKVLSIHAIKAAGAVLDILEETGALQNCTCIFHWFSDSNDQLHRAIKAGCFFSIGPYMAMSRRGREYVKVIPVHRMLLETDAPPTGDGATIDAATGEPRIPYTHEQLRDDLLIAAAAIAKIKGAAALEVIHETSLRIFEAPLKGAR